MKITANKKTALGQVAIEYMICMMLAVILLIGMIETTAWTGRELSYRIQQHQSVLVTPLNSDNNQGAVLEQIRPKYYSGSDFEGIPIASNVFGDLFF